MQSGSLADESAMRETMKVEVIRVTLNRATREKRNVATTAITEARDNPLLETEDAHT